MYKVKNCKIKGILEIEPVKFQDSRGENIKPFHKNQMNKIGIECDFMEDLMVKSKKGVIRGLHFQSSPFTQAKLIYCAKGSIFDVALDIRKESPTYGEYISFILDSTKNNMIYIPEGFAHGYQALEEDTVVIYKMTSIYSKKHENGIKWDTVNVEWPIKKVIVSDKDNILVEFEKFISPF